MLSFLLWLALFQLLVLVRRENDETEAWHTPSFRRGSVTIESTKVARSTIGILQGLSVTAEILVDETGGEVRRRALSAKRFAAHKRNIVPAARPRCPVNLNPQRQLCVSPKSWDFRDNGPVAEVT